MNVVVSFLATFKIWTFYLKIRITIFNNWVHPGFNKISTII